MIEIRKAIQMQLKTVTQRVYFQKSPEPVAFPHIVYDIPNYRSDGEGLNRMVLDVDGWDNSTDTTALEVLMAEVVKALDKKTLYGNKVYATFYLENRISIAEDDANIIRRKYIFEAHIFERS